MRLLPFLLTGGVILGVLAPDSVFAQKRKCAANPNGSYSCPDVGPPYPKPQCWIEDFNDKKGDKWKVSW